MARHVLALTLTLVCWSCGGSAQHETAPAPRVVHDPEQVPRQPSAPTPPPAPAPYGCSDSSECVLFCPEVPGCCGNACGCNSAVNARHVAELEAEYARSCARPPDCPAVGCAYRNALGAACVEGRCVALSGP